MGECIILRKSASVKDKGLIDFPITISTIQPQPIRSGHIWIQSEHGNNLTNSYILDVITNSIPNNSLIFKVGDTNNLKFSLNNDSKTLVTNNKFNITFNTEITGNHPWIVSGASKVGSLQLSYPTVFIKTNNVIYLETSYVWDGTEWIMLCSADTYLLSSVIYFGNTSTGSVKGAPIAVFNKTETEFTKHEDINNIVTNPIDPVCFNVAALTSNVVLYMGATTIDIYKREGDVFTLFKKISNEDVINLIPSIVNRGKLEIATRINGAMKTITNSSSVVRVSANGQYLYIAYSTTAAVDTSASENIYVGLLCFKITENNLEYVNHTEVMSFYTDKAYLQNSKVYCSISLSNDCSIVGLFVNYLKYNYTTYSNYYCNKIGFGSPTDKYSIKTVSESTTNYLNTVAISPDGSVAVFPNKTSSSYGEIATVYKINKINKSVVSLGNSFVGGNMLRGIYITPKNNIYCVGSHSALSGSPAYIHSSSVSTENNSFKYYGNLILTNGIGTNLYTSSGNSVPEYSPSIVKAMLIDEGNDLYYISTGQGIHICTAIKDIDNRIISFTRTKLISIPAGKLLYNNLYLVPQS